MKLHRYSILSIIIVMLSAITFDISSYNAVMDSTSENKIEITLEEKESKNTLDEKLIAYVPEPCPKETKPFNGFVFSAPIVDQLYLNNIFKPPIFC